MAFVVVIVVIAPCMEGVAKVYSDRWLMACMEVSMVPEVTTKSD